MNKQSRRLRSATIRCIFLSSCLAAVTPIPFANASMQHICVSIDESRIDYERFAERLPTLAPGVFPTRPDSVRFDLLKHREGRVQLNAFHRRGESVGFSGGLDARVRIDPRTGLRKFSMTRVDDDCLAAAMSRRVSPDRLCASVVATEIQRGAYTLSFKYGLLNHQLEFTLLQSRDRPDEWSMVASRRPGEPQTLKLQLGNDSGTQPTRWSVVHESARSNFMREISSSVPTREMLDTKFSPFEFGMLSSLSLFDDLSDDHGDWVLYNEQVDVFQPPDLGEGDIYGCHDVGGVCGAEYDTCIPNGGSWLGCNDYPGDPPWGGGHGGGGGGDIGTPPWDDTDPGTDPGGDPEPEPEPDDDGKPASCDNDGLPDWVVGTESSEPRFESPIVRSARFAPPDAANGFQIPPIPPGLAAYVISYEITSLLQSGPAQPQTLSDLTGEPPAAHVIQLTMRDVAGAFWCDLGVRYSVYASTITIPAGDFVTYRQDDDDPTCLLDYTGYYKLHYELDPYFLWLEGVGEIGNSGTFRGVVLPQQP